MSEPAREPATGGGTTEEHPGEFRIGACLSKSFGIFFRNFVPFVILAFIFSLPAIYAERLFATATASDGGIFGAAGPWIVLILGVFLSMFVTATITFGTIRELRGTRASIGESLSRGLPLAVRVIGVSIVAGIGLMVGFMLLVIPGIYLTVVWAVIVPVAVVERAGIFDCLRRSSELTEGYRWQVVGTILLYWLVAWAFSFGVGFVVGFVGHAMNLFENDIDMQTVISALTSPVTSAWIAVVIAVMYHDLRIAKEGGDTEQIAAVFD